MRFLSTVRTFLSYALRRGHIEREMEEEFRSHLAIRAAEMERQGIPKAEAERQARIEFGGYQKYKEECREALGTRLLQELVADARYGLRQLRRNPGFTIIAVVTLALGIGANVAIFSLINQVLLASLPVPHPEQLVVLSSTEAKPGTTDTESGDTASVFSYPMYKHLRSESRVVFSGLLACYPEADVNVSWHGQPERARAELVSGNFFQVLGVQPALGRVFLPDDETAPGANPVAVLSYAYWEQHFGGDPAILNRTLVVNATPLTVVGVAAQGFTGDQAGATPELYIPITMSAQMVPNGISLDNVSDYFLCLIGRLRPAVSRVRAQAELRPAFRSILAAEVPILIAHKNIVSEEGQKRFLAGKIELASGAQGRPALQPFLQVPMAILMGMVGLVLLIACANLAGLLLARGEARQHEIAVRLAVGAGRGRLIRQLLTESLIVAIGGGAAGLLVGWWTLRAVVYSLPRIHLVTVFFSGVTARLDPRVLAFTAALTILSALFFGLLPALRASRTDLQGSLKEQGGRGLGGAESARLRKLLVVGQVASAATLLIAAALFRESLVRVERTNVGVRVGHVIQFSMEPNLSRYSPAQTAGLFSQLRQDITALPGVEAVGAAEVPVFGDYANSDTLTYQDFKPRKSEDLEAQVNYVSPSFFSTLGIPLMRGREFLPSDSASSPKVVVVNEKLAQKFFPGRNPVGMHLGIGEGPVVHPDIEIVGVVANAKTWDARLPVMPSVFFPYTQDAGLGNATFYVRTARQPSAMMATLRKLASRDAPNVPINDLRTLEEQRDNSILMFGQRMLTVITLNLASLAALLAALGLYGVMAYSVVRRTREIAIRMALGAERKSVLTMVVGQGLKLALIGVAIGIAGALALTRLLASLLYGVKPTDPLTFIAVSLILIAVALVACYIPARRAAKVDPMVALRYE